MPPLPVGPALHATAPVYEPTPIHQNCGLPMPALGDAAIQSRPPVGPYAALDLMPNRAVLPVHPNQFATFS